MNKLLYFLPILLLYPVLALAQSGQKTDTLQPTLTVTGHGEVHASPDRAIVRLGAVAQAKEAADAQQQASKIVNQALQALKQMNIASDKITTVGLTLSPVYSRPNPKGTGEPQEPIIAGYRARNSIQVVIDDIGKVGDVIDACVTAGANQLENISFEIGEEGKLREQALRQAVVEARKKADAIAEAVGVEIAGVDEISEGGINFIRPQMQMARTFTAEAATPVQPGQVSVEASVTIRYRISEGNKAQEGASAT